MEDPLRVLIVIWLCWHISFQILFGIILLFWLGWLNNFNSSDTFRLASLMRCWKGKEKNTGVLSILTNTFHLSIRLFRSARTSCRTFESPSTRPPVRDNFSWVHIYRHTCLMNHQKSHQTNLMAQRDPIDAPLTPWDPVGLPLDPLGPCRPTPWPPETL